MRTVKYLYIEVPYTEVDGDERRKLLHKMVEKFTDSDYAKFSDNATFAEWQEELHAAIDSYFDIPVRSDVYEDDDGVNIPMIGIGIDACIGRPEEFRYFQLLYECTPIYDQLEQWAELDLGWM